MAGVGMRWNLCLRVVVAAVVSQSIFAPAGLGQETAAPARWKAAIEKFEKEDQLHPTKPGGTVFVGSSSIRLWDLKKSFPEIDPLNRGFGGSEMADSVEFCRQLVLKHKPRLIVVYAGDNDLAHGTSAEEIADDLAEFVGLVRAELPEAKIIFLSVKPSIARWKLIEEQNETNKRCAAVLATDPHAVFLDVGACLLTADGKPDPKFFLADGLHLNPAGYALWNDLLRPHLE